MNLRVCDICYYQKPSVIKDGRWTLSHKSPFSKISIHACAEHKDFFKGHTFDENLNRLMVLKGHKTA